MPRIQPVESTSATGAAAEQLAATRKLFGSTPNMFATAAQSPATLTALNGFFAALGKASLGGRIGEQIAIAIAQSNGCEYCLSAHTAIGTMHGVSAANLSSARHGRSDDPRAQAAITLALEIVRTKGRVPDAALAAARVSGLGDAEIVEVVGHV
ncbi:MAG: carboxymuconolactone decarboxylase family protein, partial [Gemmatimonadaceae bacterium]|nr:carboxymuconolactone decarboxylase family protein [Gemmatimonadaceae bacterium]